MSRTDFNRAPYFDDFDPSKNYLRVLFQPGRPVQARELNQIQSTFQNQIERFANHIFKNGSKVSNGRVALNAKSYVRLVDLLGDSSPVNVENYPEGTKLLGVVSGIKAVLVKGVNAEAGDPPTIFVVYTTTGIDGQTDKFIPGEEIQILDENDVAVYTVEVRCPDCEGSELEGELIPPTGTAQFFTVDEGIFYYEGMFIENARQNIIVQKYLLINEEGNISNAEPCKLGFDFLQDIVTFEDDASLLDPSLGYPNSTAPGADRYKVTLSLVKRGYEDADGENFVLLCKIGENMRVEFIKSEAEYAELMDMIAKRTFETNGNYTIRPFRISLFEDKKVDNNPRGWSVNGDLGYAVAVMSPSVAYVKGYRVETFSDTPVKIRKARDTKQVPGFVKRFNDRTYLTIRSASDAIWTNDGADPSTMGDSIVSIYDGPLAGTTPSGAVIGTFRVNDMVRLYGTPEDNTLVSKYYIYDLQITVPGKKLTDAQSFASPDGEWIGEAVVDPVTNKFEVYNANSTGLIYSIDRENVKTLRANDNSANGSIAVTLRKKFTGVMSGGGSVVFNTTTNEFFNGFSNSLVGWAVSPSNEITPVNLTGLNTTVDPTTLTIDLGAGFAGYTMNIITDVLRTNQKEKTKTLTTSTYNTSTVPGWLAGDTELLGFADVVKINFVKVTSIVDPLFEEDITSEYKLVKNITDLAYKESYIQRLSENTVLSGNSNYRLMVSFDYFAHTGSQGYFTIDSYSQALNDPLSGITYENLEDYVASNKNVYSINNTFDFRPVVIAGDDTNALLPANGSTAIFDIEYYLPRIDLIQINKEGNLYSKEGTSSETPVLPRPDENAMVLYEVYLQPYTYSLNDIKTKFIENKRYTMRDIGRLESRIENIEYYTALNLLEKSAADMSIKDENGLDRFKNGFVADNFSDYQAADLSHPEFKAGADRGYRELRPKFKARNKKLTIAIAKCVNVELRGNVAMLPFEEVLTSTNPFATKHLSINPYFQYNKRGTVFLSPNNDVWSDENILPQMVVDIDSGVEAFQQLADAAGVLGTDWGSWVDQNRTILGTETSTNTSTSNIGNQILNSTTTTVTNTVQTTAVRTGTATTVESRTNEYTLGDVVRDVQIVPFMRTRIVEFHATKLKANTQVWAFFDGEPVSQHCRDIGVQLSALNAPQIRSRVAYGSPLITDANGEIRGEFRIPANTFFTGEKLFVLKDDSQGESDQDAVTTSAETSYFAGGLDITRQNVTLNVITPTFSTRDVTETETRTDTETTRVTDTTVTTIPTPPPPVTGECSAVGRSRAQIRRVCPCATNPTGWWCRDPVAQAFLTETEMTLTSLDIFFKQFDPESSTIFVEIRTMSNGYPTEMVLGRQELFTADLIADEKFSEDSTVPLNVEFDTPIFLEGNTQYCFVVGGYSPNTRIWVARLGQEVVNMPGKIVEQPPTGQVSFRSLNGSTWNAEQFEAIKYNIYGAQFDSGAMELVFENAQQEKWNLDNDPLEFQAGSNLMRVYARDHGFVENDRVRLSVLDDLWIDITADDNLPPQVGQYIHTISGGGTIVEVGVVNEGASSYRVKIKNHTGVFLENEQYTADAISRTHRDVYLAEHHGTKKSTIITMNEAFGVFDEDSFAAAYPGGTIAGIDLTDINKQHVIVAVDSMDSFIVELTSNAVNSGRFGGSDVVAWDFNEKYELFNVSGSYTNLRGGQAWTLRGLGHGRDGEAFFGDDYIMQPEIGFLPGQDKFLSKPFKIASADNEVRVLGADKSIEVKAEFTTSNPNVSPMINIDTFSITSVSNRVEKIIEADYEQAPNATGRFIDELDGYRGVESYKYVTRPILLNDPANDLMIFFDVYKDINADFDVYIKRITPYETRDFDDVEWMLVDGIDKSRSSFDLSDRIEYEIKASEMVTGWLDGDDEFVPFTGFKIKIVGRTTNSAKPPLFRSLRGIAVV